MQSKVKKVNLSSQLTDTMIGLIEAGDWSSGMKLPSETELAASFSVSRNIMRQALKIMESFGILESKAGTGTLVSENALSAIRNTRFFDDLKNNASVESILETRLIIEPDLAYYAALRGSDADLQALRGLHEQHEVGQQDQQAFRTDDFNFHMCIARASGNLILENLLFSMLDQLRESNYVEFDRHAQADVVRRGYENHREIAAAILDRDPSLAKVRMHEHLRSRISAIRSSGGKVHEC